MPTTTITRSTTDGRTALAPGDVILYRFPLAEADSSEPPKARPCLVLDVIDRNGRAHAIVAYGTSRRTRANRGLEIHVRRPADRSVAGLNRATRFVGARRTTVELDDADLHDATGPVLGRLEGGPLERLQVVRNRLIEDAAAPADCS